MANKKVIHISTKSLPEWLNKDIEKYIQNKDNTFKPGYVLSQIYNQYSSGYKQIVSVMTGNTEWIAVARERLAYIDENLELILKTLKRKRLQPNSFSVTNIAD